MRLQDVVERYGGSLTEADRRLVGLLLNDPVASSYLPASDLAQRAGVHESTAGRLARKLGFENYRDLKNSLRATHLSEADSAAGRIRARLGRAAERSILDVLIESEIRALAAVPRQIDARTMTQAATALRDAGRIYLFGQGHAASLMDLFARRLWRSGYLTVPVNHADWEAVDRLTPLSRGDVLVACTFRRPVERLDILLRHAMARGARTIVISDLSALVTDPGPDITLAASRGPDSESQSLTVPMAICNALILELSRIDKGRSIAALEQRGNLANALAEKKAGGTKSNGTKRGRATPRKSSTRAKEGDLG